MTGMEMIISTGLDDHMKGWEGDDQGKNKTSSESSAETAASMLTAHQCKIESCGSETSKGGSRL